MAPIKYLEAGARLFNMPAMPTKLELASKYLEAADRYRDMLQPDEQATLDAYLKELAKAKSQEANDSAAAAAPAAAMPGQGSAAVRPTPSYVAPKAAAPLTTPVAAGTRDGLASLTPTAPPAASNRGPAGPDQIGPAVNARGRARWLLHEARENLIKGNYDEAQAQGRRGRGPRHQVGAVRRHARPRCSEDIKKARPSGR